MQINCYHHKRNHGTRHVILFLLALIHFAALASPALSKLHHDLRVLSVERRTNLQTQKTLDLKIAALSAQTNQLLMAKQRSALALKALSQQNQILSAQLHNAQQLFARQLALSYTTDDKNNLKMVLNGDDINQTARLIHYAEVLDHDRFNIVKNYQTRLQQIKIIQQKMQNQTIADAHLQQQLSQQQTALLYEKAQQQKLQQQLDARYQNKQQQWQALTANQNALQTAVSNHASNGISTNMAKIASNFSEMRKRLPWPTVGKHYAHDDNLGKQSPGIFIAASTGRPVHAIYAGRVIFAGWLQGLGLLVIIDHGDGYLSLYGHNEQLYQRAGTLVHGGELIGMTGNSGGAVKSGLYFSIRYNGKPLPPEQWCRG